MKLSSIAEQFLAEAPFAFLMRAVFEHEFSDAVLDDIFEQHAQRQYERALLFSDVVDLLTKVVLRGGPSVRASFLARQQGSTPLTVSITSVYNKLNRIELQTSAALVRVISERCAALITRMKAQKPPLIPGYRTLVLDGNHLAATEHRLEVLRDVKEAPLPGESLVLLDPALDQAVHCIPCENGHAQERSLVEEVLALVGEKDCLIADRNLATTRMLVGLIKRDATFIMRQHGNCLRWRLVGPRRKLGRVDTGVVYEQRMVIKDEDETEHELRRLTLLLDVPTRDNETALHILTNLPKAAVQGRRIVALYRERWTIEVLFLNLTQALRCEVNTLGYPKAALFAFALALTAYNLLSTVRGAIRREHGPEKEEELSEHALAVQIGSATPGLAIALPSTKWAAIRACSDADFAAFLRKAVRRIDLRWYRKTTRGPKKPARKRRSLGGPSNHIATSKLLAKAQAAPP